MNIKWYETIAFILFVGIIGTMSVYIASQMFQDKLLVIITALILLAVFILIVSGAVSFMRKVIVEDVDGKGNKNA